jgi:general secretion pathway protein G
VVIDQFHADTGRYPDSLEELVDKRYLRSLPYDPIAESASSWIIEAPEEGGKGLVYNVRSGAQGTGRNGIAYGEW